MKLQLTFQLLKAEENRLGADIIRMFGASCVLARASTGPRPSRKMLGLLRLEACWLGIRLMRGFLDSSNATVTSQLVFYATQAPSFVCFPYSGKSHVCLAPNKTTMPVEQTPAYNVVTHVPTCP